MDISEQIRRAVQAANFDQAQLLIPVYRDELSRELNAASNDKDRRQRLQAAIDRVAESLHLARVIRAHIATKLRNTESLSRYQCQQAGESRWSIRG